MVNATTASEMTINGLNSKDDGAMNSNERWVLFCTLLLIGGVVLVDLLTDTSQGVATWHLWVEGAAGLLALAGAGYVLLQMFSLQGALRSERQAVAVWQQEAQQWRAHSKAYLAGLSSMIDQQLSVWGLTPSEREVAFLLLKGMSLKDIAGIRGTSEKTARVQSMAVYAKSGLAGRSELAAFFLEDLLPAASSDTTD